MAGPGLPVDRLPDETLLAGLAAGDHESTLAFVRRFQRRVFGIAMAVVGDAGAAEDVAQLTFERVWRHAQVFDVRRGSVQSWVSTIAHRLAIDAVRARRPNPVDPFEMTTVLGVDAEGPEQRSLADESAAELRAALRRLPREQATALLMAGIYGLTAQQVAEAEGIPLGTAKTRIRLGMQKLRVLLADEESRDG